MTADVLNPVGLERICEKCGAGFAVADKWSANRFCSRSCANSRPRRRRSITERFWPKVNKNGPIPGCRPDLGPCWIWTASRTSAGYGQISDDARVLVVAHRWSWEQENGLVPDGLELDHLCRNRACVRPDHLEAVTRSVNAQRGLKGDLKPAASLREVCANGHLMTPENRFLRKDGTGKKVGCRQCSRDSSRRHYDKARRVA